MYFRAAPRREIAFDLARARARVYASFEEMIDLEAANERLSDSRDWRIGSKLESNVRLSLRALVCLPRSMRDDCDLYERTPIALVSSGATNASR